MLNLLIPQVIVRIKSAKNYYFPHCNGRNLPVYHKKQHREGDIWCKTKYGYRACMCVTVVNRSELNERKQNAGSTYHPILIYDFKASFFRMRKCLKLEFEIFARRWEMFDKAISRSILLNLNRGMMVLCLPTDHCEETKSTNFWHEFFFHFHVITHAHTHTHLSNEMWKTQKYSVVILNLWNFLRRACVCAGIELTLQHIYGVCIVNIKVYIAQSTIMRLKRN